MKKKFLVGLVVCSFFLVSSAEAWNWKTAWGGGLISAVLAGGVIGGVATAEGEDFWPMFGMGALVAFPLGFLMGGVFGKDKKSEKKDESTAFIVNKKFVAQSGVQLLDLPIPAKNELSLSTF